jgi:hypothetical protein
MNARIDWREASEPVRPTSDTGRRQMRGKRAPSSVNLSGGDAATTLDALWATGKRWSLRASASIAEELVDACPALALLSREHRQHFVRVFAALDAGSFDSQKYERER